MKIIARNVVEQTIHSEEKMLSYVPALYRYHQGWIALTS